MSSPSSGRPPRIAVPVALLSALALVAVPSSAAAAGRFLDVPASHTFRTEIARLADAGITRGCNPSAGNSRFCPDGFVTRGQMAAFLDRALDLPAGRTVFGDTRGHTFEANISALARAGITSGCGGDRFCPDAYVSRGQMAAFLDRALDLPAGRTVFGDTRGHTFQSNISALARAGITRGCNPSSGNTRFCPDDAVTRGQMAAFLVRAGVTDPVPDDSTGSSGGAGGGSSGGSGSGGSSSGGGPDGGGPDGGGSDGGGSSGSSSGTGGSGGSGGDGTGGDGSSGTGGSGGTGGDGTGGGWSGGGGGAGGDDPGGGTDAVTRTIDVGKDHSCRVIADATVRCWGVNSYGQLGDGTAWSAATSPFGRSTPVEVVGITDADAVTAGEGHTCVLHADGTVHCWGSNFHGELGDSTAADDGSSPDYKLVPVEVTGLSDAVDVAAGRGHTCALRTGGSVVCWGFDRYGQLGDGTTGSSGNGPMSNATPATVAGVDDVVAIDAGGLHVCALRGDGSVWCWGFNADGQIGDGTSLVEGTSAADRPTPSMVAGVAGATSISTGRDHSCATLSTGTVTCWGDNGYGQLGTGSSEAEGTGPAIESTPVVVAGVTGATSLDAGHAHTCAVGGDGTIGCWGWNGWGQLGDGTSVSQGTSPVARSTAIQVAGITDADAVGGGLNHACAVRTDGSVACWGGNVSGQLGDGTSKDAGTSPNVRSTPVGVLLP